MSHRRAKKLRKIARQMLTGMVSNANTHEMRFNSVTIKTRSGKKLRVERPQVRVTHNSYRGVVRALKRQVREQRARLRYT